MIGGRRKPGEGGRPEGGRRRIGGGARAGPGGAGVGLGVGISQRRCGGDAGCSFSRVVVVEREKQAVEGRQAGRKIVCVRERGRLK